jgi:hypothetical protein
MSPPAALEVPSELNGVHTRRLTVDDVPALRAKTQVPLGVAAVSSSDMFKSPVRIAGLCIYSMGMIWS